MTKLFIKKGVLTICLNLTILLMGYFTLPYLSKEFIPTINIPAVAVIFPTPFLPESKIVQKLVNPVERALEETGDLDSVEVHMGEERVIMILFYKWKYAPETCLRRARQVIENVPRPKEIMDPIFILHRPTGRPILRNVFYGKSIVDITKFTEKVALKVERIPGISEVSLSGKNPDQYEINLDPKKMAKHQLNYTDIIKTSRESWSFRQLFKSTPLKHYMVFNVDSVENLGSLSLKSNKKQESILLRWLGKIQKQKPNPKVIYGKDEHALILEVLKAPGTDTMAINQNVLRVIQEEVRARKDIKSQVIYDEAEKIKQSQEGVLQNFVIGVILNSIILIAFLGSSIGALVASVVFPTALLGTLFIQSNLGISLNLFSLNGFSLAVGMITDASTVVLESITRRFQNGEDIFSACWKGTRDVSLGVVASTLTTAGVLIPIAMQKNLSSKLFSDLSLTVVSTQLLCLIAVFTLVPWLCFKIFKRDAKPALPIAVAYKYTSIIVSTMIGFAHNVQALARNNQFYKKLIPGAVVIFNLGMILFLPQTEFLPSITAPVYSLNYPIKNARSERDQIKLRDQFAELINSNSDILWSVSTARGDRVEILFELKKSVPKKEIKKFLEHPLIDEHNINIQTVGPAGSGEEYGYDGIFYITQNIKKDKIEKIINRFCKSKYIDYCQDHRFNLVHEIELTPDPIISTRMGGSSIQSAMELAVGLRNLDLVAVGNLIFKWPFIMKTIQESLITENPIPLGTDNITSLKNLFYQKIKSSFAKQIRYNHNDYSPLYFRIKKGTLGEISSFMSQLAHEETGKTESVLGMGGLKTMDESFASMIRALILSAIIIFIILAVQFQSPRQAAIIMGTIPLTLGGAIAGLIIMGETVNASVMVGFILLIGIVVNNGIFLVEATNQKLLAGYNIAKAVTESVAERTRPILMTSFSTIFGMLPTIVLGGEGSELYRGMAIVNVFGMVAGTVLSVVITPIFIEIFAKKEQGSTQ